MTHPWETPPHGPNATTANLLAAALPRLATPRLTLRPPRIGDFDAYAAILCGDRATGIGGPFSRADAWTDFNQAVAGWLLRGHGLWAVETHAGALLGFVLLHHEFGDPEPELGFLFLPEAEGQGYGFEAATAARDHAFAALHWPSVVSFIAPANARSRRLAERLGGQIDPAVVLDDEDPCLTYRYLNPYFAPRQTPRQTP